MTISNKKKGFTLIELLVVIAIIALLTSIVIASLAQARSKGRDAKRLRDLTEIRTALELYRVANGKYPQATPVTNQWRGLCPTYNASGTLTTSGPNGYIPNLAPNYIDELPQDPKPNLTNGCYLYRASLDGSEYMFLINGTVEGAIIPSLVRPISPTAKSYAIYTSGAGANF